MDLQSETEDQGKHQDKAYDQLKKEGKRKTWGPPRRAKIVAEGKRQIVAEGKRPIDEVDADLKEGDNTRKKVKTSSYRPRRKNDEKDIPHSNSFEG